MDLRLFAMPVESFWQRFVLLPYSVKQGVSTYGFFDVTLQHLQDSGHEISMAGPI